MITLYGIPNCDTVKKARAWLSERQIAVEFVDFKKQPPAAALIESWLADIPADILLNRRGTTWRTLNDAQKAQAGTLEGAIALMSAHPSLIKRPILTLDGRHHAGFQAGQYEALFERSTG